MPDAALEQTILAGKKKDPRQPYFIKRKEIHEYLDKEFSQMYRIWKMFHGGYGLPGNKSWDELPCQIMDIIETIQDEYDYMVR